MSRPLSRGLAVLTLCVLFLATLVFGAGLGPRGSLSALLGQAGGYGNLVVFDIRLPRAVGAVLAGCALGVAGAISQAIFRNELASPDVLGVSSGAAFGTVFGLTSLHLGGLGLRAAAIVGASVASLHLLLLAGRVSAYALLLIGFAGASVFSAAVSLLLVNASLQDASVASVWLTGNLNGTVWSGTVVEIAGMAGAASLAFTQRHRLDILRFEDDTGLSVGLHVGRSRACWVGICAVFTGLGTAIGGPIAFISLISPILARRINRGEIALWESALTGAALVLVADLVGRLLLYPTELPVGVVSGVVGGLLLVRFLVRSWSWP